MKELYSDLSDRLMSLATTAQVDGKIDGADLLHALTAASAMFNEAVDVIENQDKYRWHNLIESPNDLPPVEHEVDIRCRCGNHFISTHGMYEDGTIHSENSDWCWNEIWNFAEYCEETDDYIIPEGWWEYRHYNDGNSYNFPIDDAVIAWREIEPFKENL